VRLLDSAPAAVLWDMDGLLVDSEPLWTVAEVELAEALGGTWTDAIKVACMGKRLDLAVPVMLEGLGVPATPTAVRDAADLLLARMVVLLAEEVPVLPGVAELLGQLAAAAVPQALVSSSFRVLVDAVLVRLDAPPFAVTLAGDEVTHAKPHPEPWLTAAGRLGVDPARCVVLEDSAAGVASGLAAGCTVVAVGALGAAPPAGATGVPSLAALL